MDISKMILSDADTPVSSISGADDDSPQNLDDPVISETGGSAAEIGEELSAVERIRAYRSGKLQAPIISRAELAGDDDNDPGAAGAAPAADGDSGADEPDGEADESSDGPDVGGAGSQQSSPAELDAPRRWPVRVPRKALVFGIPAVMLIGAGIVVPGVGGHHKPGDSTAVPDSVARTVQKASPSGAGAAIADGVIAPSAVEAPAYPISLTPPLDAFSGEKNKAWVCAGLDGTSVIIHLPGPTAIAEIDVVPGFVGRDRDGSDLWGKHRIVTDAAYYLDYSDKPVPATFTDKPESQSTSLGGAITRTVQMVILGTKDVSGKGPVAGTASASPSAAPGLLGDLGPLGSFNLDEQSSAESTAQTSRPPSFAVGHIKIIGHPAR
jgi:hypothetical protein